MLHDLADDLRALAPHDSQYAVRFVDCVLRAAQRLAASDIHFQPTAQGLELRLRVDGVLQSAGVFSLGEVSDIVTRLKVLASLLTYRSDLPQEGRLQWPAEAIEMRLSTIPTLHGERAVVRLFSAEAAYHRIADLQFPAALQETLGKLLGESSGAILITGPAGAGKTTTAYACLREMAHGEHGPRSIVSLEDPIESAIDGVAQSEVRPEVGFDLYSGLKSLLRQDPQVLLLGEMRDAATARVIMEASLTGQLVLTTFHAGSAAEAIGRLTDMGAEPYMLRSGLLAIINQRLVRRLCACAIPANEDDFLGLEVAQARKPRGCEVCAGVGYRGRIPLVEWMIVRGQPVASALLARLETAELERHAVQEGMRLRWHMARELIEAGQTSPSEVRRVLGFLHE